jgi:hypothetical protein
VCCVDISGNEESLVVPVAGPSGAFYCLR